MEASRNPAIAETDEAEEVKAAEVNDSSSSSSSYAITEPSMDDEITAEKEASMASVLATYRETLVERSKYQLGYPCTMNSDYGAVSQLQHLYTDHFSNASFMESSSHGVHVKQFEAEVLDWFARLWEIEKEDYWGYITSCGSEGNLHGILLGREAYPDGVLYASKECHYSIFKAARMYRMELVKLESLVSGAMDCSDLKAQLQTRKHRPAIIVVNIGTTVKGGVDDLDLVIKTLSETGFTEDRFYIHCDGALFGFMLPFVDKAPKVTFKKPISSMSVSGHKFLGCPIPCGVQITRKKFVNVLSRNADQYCGWTSDATLVGNMNIHMPIFMWYTLNRRGYGGFQKDVQRCLRNARYLKDRLREAGFGVMLNKPSTTVVFERPPNDSFVRKWHLPCQGNVAHAVVMPSDTIEKLDEFIEDLVQNRLACFAGTKVVAPCVANAIGKENCAHCIGANEDREVFSRSGNVQIKQ